MSYQRKFLALVALLAFGWSFRVSAQAPGVQPNPNATLKSVEVLPDHKVTFRIYAPKANAVTVSGDWITQGRGTGGPMQKDDRGVWSLTVGPLIPDFYGYGFNVDGVTTMDPKATAVKQSVSGASSYFELPGAEAVFEDNQQVPHGEIREAWYLSANLNEQRRLHIYTPPGYEMGSAKYPVLYLIHGGGDDDSGWSSVGRMGFIMDNLIAANKAKPMIVVMPNGGSIQLPGPAPEPPKMAADGRPDMSASLIKQHDAFAADLIGSILPFVEKNYRVLASQPNRAIAGLSMGGDETLRTGPRNIDKFAYIGIFSMGLQSHVNPDFEQINADFLSNPDRTNKLVKLFWIGVGSNDQVVHTSPQDLSAELNKHGIHNELHVSDGGHTWINWRAYLEEFAPLLFR